MKARIMVLPDLKGHFIKNLEYCVLLTVKISHPNMKKIAVLTFCLFTYGYSIAQNNGTPKPSPTPGQGKPAVHKSAIGGFIRDARNLPQPDVKVFVYAPDSSINSSGYTDAMGYYETNSTFAGSYTVKIVYPTNKAVMVTGVPIKLGITDLSIKANPPAEDTTLPYSYFAPKPVEKVKTGKKKTQ